MAISTSGERMLAGSLEASSFSLISGYRARKLPMRGMSQSDSSAGTQVTLSEPDVVGRVMRAVAAAMPSKAEVTAGSSSAPWPVSLGRCPARSRSRTCSEASSARIWWLTAPWVTLSSTAALVSEPCRAAASKARRGLSGGRRLAKTSPVVSFPHTDGYNNINCLFNSAPPSFSHLERTWTEERASDGPALPAWETGRQFMGSHKDRLEALRAKYGESHGGELFDPRFRRVADRIFSKSGTRLAPYAGVPTLLSAPYRAIDPVNPDFGDLQVALLGVPMDLGVTNRPGSRFGPRALRAIERIGPYNHVLDCAPVFELEVADIGDVPFASRYRLEQSHADIEAHVRKIVEAGVL